MKHSTSTNTVILAMSFKNEVELWLQFAPTTTTEKESGQEDKKMYEQ